MSDEVPIFGRRLRRARERRGWSQAELALQAGCDRSLINRLESGDRENLTLETALKIARALSVGVDYLADTFGDIASEVWLGAGHRLISPPHS